MKFDHTQDDMYIALTEKGHFGHLQFTTMQFSFMPTSGHTKSKLKITNIGNISWENLTLTYIITPSFDFIFKELHNS